jgi:hypothetical protein
MEEDLHFQVMEATRHPQAMEAIHQMHHQTMVAGQLNLQLALP